MWRVNENPYKSPSEDSLPTIVKRRRPISARLFFVGAALASIGTALFYGLIVYQLYDNTLWEENLGGRMTPLWFRAPAVISMVMAPLGAALAIIGGAMWIAEQARRKRQ